MSDYHTRKAVRTDAYNRLHGVKMETCAACAGSGYYDADGSPPCSSCNGSGKTRQKLNVLPTDPVPAPQSWRDGLKQKTRLRKLKRALRG